MEIHKTFHDCLPNLCSNAITGKCVASGYEGVLDDRDQILELHHKRLSYLVQICLVMVGLSGSAYIPIWCTLMYVRQAILGYVPFQNSNSIGW